MSEENQEEFTNEFNVSNNVNLPIEREKFLCREFIKIEMRILNDYNKPKFTSILMYRKKFIEDSKQVINFIIDAINNEQILAMESLFDTSLEPNTRNENLVRAYCLECIRIIITENYNLLCNLSYYDLYDPEKCIKDSYCNFISNRVEIKFTKFNYDFISMSCFTENSS